MTHTGQVVTPDPAIYFAMQPHDTREHGTVSPGPFPPVLVAPQVAERKPHQPERLLPLNIRHACPWTGSAQIPGLARQRSPTLERAALLVLFGVRGSSDEPDDRVLSSGGATAGLEVHRAVGAYRGERQHIGADGILDQLDRCAGGDPGLDALQRDPWSKGMK